MGAPCERNEARRRRMEVAWYWLRSLLNAYCGVSSDGARRAAMASVSRRASPAAWRSLGCTPPRATRTTWPGRGSVRISALTFAGFEAELAEAEGFEPSYADPKSAVLPLDDASEPFRRTGDSCSRRALPPRVHVC